jgi:hypothetical protein
MALQQLVYVSTPFGFDRPTLAGILVGARANNARDGLTGCLICRATSICSFWKGRIPHSPPAGGGSGWMTAMAM